MLAKLQQNLHTAASRKPNTMTVVRHNPNLPTCGRDQRAMTNQALPGSGNWSSSQAQGGSPGRGPQQQQRRYQPPAEKPPIDERGWWEKPEEQSMQAYVAQPLDPWQEERLERAYAADGRRKIKVQALAEELGLDRVRVISWAKEFSQRPAG